jgi:OOP family OmpA-OmpF porin
MLKSAAYGQRKKGEDMRLGTLLAAASLSACFGCATQEAPQPAPAPAPTPAPAPAAVQPPPPPPPVVQPAPAPRQPVSIASTELFEFNQATLTPAARALLDKEVLERMREFGNIRIIRISGHADRVGGEQYNDKLSYRRAEAVRAYLVSKGVDRAQIATFAFGEARPVSSCADGVQRKALIECLAPNRRVEIDIQGTPR